MGMALFGITEGYGIEGISTNGPNTTLITPPPAWSGAVCSWSGHDPTNADARILDPAGGRPPAGLARSVGPTPTPVLGVGSLGIQVATDKVQHLTGCHFRHGNGLFRSLGDPAPRWRVSWTKSDSIYFDPRGFQGKWS